MNELCKQYKLMCDELRQECDNMVDEGLLTEEEADFRYYMVRDEILI